MGLVENLKDEMCALEIRKNNLQKQINKISSEPLQLKNKFKN